ncbi:MAG TPA: serine hydrolase domain-containing protein [Pyrinomonadaceae bacterium]|nr:serine hydrolase domain-containing protein [Pyrinomonadaceae bacterium]
MQRSRLLASVITGLILLISSAQTAIVSGQRAVRRVAAGSLPPARFADPDRARKLAAAFPEIEKLFNNWFAARHVPGAVFGIIIDGELVWVKTNGVRESKDHAPVTPDTVFRIASMTKSFTALSILKLRDQGKLSLDDPVARYVPALEGLRYPTNDSPTLTIRHLLTHSEGFPEDNPWGDRQLAQSDETIRAWMRAGIPFSNAPGTAYEYSNYGFAILGQVVTRVSGRPYAEYVRDEILKPLGMNSSTFEMSSVPREHIALGYRWEDNVWKDEPVLAHGSFGSMGGLWTTARDLARYVAFHLSAVPPRDEAERGPVRRSSLREMQQAWRAQPAFAVRGAVDAPLQLVLSSYAYGLSVSQDCRFNYIVGHGGGLPGYGSLMRWLPEYGVGLIAMGNLTYTPGFGGLFSDAIAALDRTGALKPRVVQPSPALLSAQNDVSQLITKWDDALAKRIAADNLFLDASAEVRAARWRALATTQGGCRTAGVIEPENALRGTWRMTCERGWLDVSITLAPTSPPRVQLINVQSTLPPDTEMTKAVTSVGKLIGGWNAKALESIAAPSLDLEKVRRQIGAMSSWGSCKMGETAGGDGSRNSTVRFACERGTVVARLALDPATHRLTNLDLVPTRDQRCVP